MGVVGLHSKLQLPLMDWIYQNEGKVSTSKRQVARWPLSYSKISHSVLEMTPRLDPPEIHMPLLPLSAVSIKNN